MTYFIKQTLATTDLKTKIFEGFKQHAIKTVGTNDLGEELALEAYSGEEFAGAIVILEFWGSLWIKLLFIEEAHRNKGLASQLMESALSFAKEKKLSFVSVETMSFQALGFYQKFGFELEFTKSGFSNDVSLHYLRKYL